MLCACGVSDRAAVGDTLAEGVSRFGTVNILVNNAGINVSPRTVADIDPADWDQIVDLKLTGIFNTIRAGNPYGQLLQFPSYFESISPLLESN